MEGGSTSFIFTFPTFYSFFLACSKLLFEFYCSFPGPAVCPVAVCWAGAEELEAAVAGERVLPLRALHPSTRISAVWGTLVVSPQSHSQHTGWALPVQCPAGTMC